MMAKNRAEFPFNRNGNDDGHARFELRMECPGPARQPPCDASSFSADERVESDTLCDGPEQWTKWKLEDDQAYRKYLDEVFEGDVD